MQIPQYTVLIPDYHPPYEANIDFGIPLHLTSKDRNREYFPNNGNLYARLDDFDK